ncbi:hypothetical protein B0H10DRAFT_2050450 [Mycena sp. CBHHK59/15]|nr:hypothetical protein B0H10DRAFT_2050450 [Mycena sp. CBHHK59/15]
MTASEVLHLQELCDYITDCHESSADLKSWALVSPTLTSSAQRHLFHDIIFNRGCSGIGDLPTGNVDEVRPCRRFCSIVKASPHLLPLVRRLRASLEDDVVKELSWVRFPNLQDVVLHRRTETLIKKKTLVAAGRIIGLPSIRRVGLIGPTFRDMQDLRWLFDHWPTQLEALLLHEVRIKASSDERGLSAPLQRATIKQLHLSGLNGPPPLLSPMCPFDISALQDIEYPIVKRMQSITALLNRGRSTITRLKAHGALNDTHIATVARLTALTHLAINDDDLAAVGRLLGALSSSNLLEVLSLDIAYTGQLGMPPLNNLRAAVMGTPLPSLRQLEIRVCPLFPQTDGVDPRSLIRTALAEFDAMGRLSVLDDVPQLDRVDLWVLITFGRNPARGNKFENRLEEGILHRTATHTVSVDES